MSLRNEIIETLLYTVYKGKDPIETRKYLELCTTEHLEQELIRYYLFDIKNKNKK